MKNQVTEPRSKIRLKSPRIRVEEVLRESRRERTIPGRTATLTILKRRPVRALLGLREAWENDLPWRHAQATGFLLGEMARNLQWTAFTFLPIVSRFILRRGPYGVDGIWLSAVSLAQRINPSGFQDAIALADEISGTVDLPHQNRFGMYFFDLGMAVSSLSVPSFADTTGLGNRTGGTVSSGIAGLSSAFGDTRPVMMSAFPDSTRGPLFNDQGIGAAVNVGGGFGVGVRGTGSDALSAYSPQAQQSLYGGLLDTSTDCLAVAADWGADATTGVLIGGGVAGFVFGSGLGPAGSVLGAVGGVKAAFVPALAAGGVTAAVVSSVCGLAVKYAKSVQAGLEQDANDAEAEAAAAEYELTVAQDEANRTAAVTKEAKQDADDAAEAADIVDAAADPEAAAAANEEAAIKKEAFDKAKADEAAAKTVEEKKAKDAKEAREKADEAREKADEAKKKKKDNDSSEAGTTTDEDEKSTYPAPPGVDSGGAGMAAITTFRNLVPRTQPPPEGLGSGNQMFHFPSRYFDEQIQTREGVDNSSGAAALLAKILDQGGLINPGS